MHRGGTINGMLVTLSILGSLTAAAFYVAPGYLNAQPARPSSVPAAYADHQSLIDLVATLIAQSVGVLAIHPRGALIQAPSFCYPASHPY